MGTKVYKQLAAQTIQFNDFPFISETSMEAFIIENQNILSTDEEISVRFVTNQFFLENGRPSKDTDGRIDMLFEIDDKYLAIIELKKGVVIKDNIEQLKDYLTVFKQSKEAASKKFGIKKDRELIGIIIGSDIDPDIKSDLLSGQISKAMKINIIGMTISRYCSEDKSEVYIFAERFAEEESDFTRIRFDDYVDFINFQKYERKVKPNVSKLLDVIHKQKSEFNMVYADRFSFTKNAMTLNVLASQRKTVYLYIKIYQTKIRAFLTLKGSTAGFEKDPDVRFPNSFYIDVDKIEDLDKTFFKKVQESYKAIADEA
jgi:hypothetical protein